MAVLSVYQPRDRKSSPLWQVFNRCYQAFEDMYDAKFEKRFGFFRAVIDESVRAFLKCGDLKQGFARIRRPNCGNEARDSQRRTDLVVFM
ncbi:MAG: hypothetical protein HOC09_20410 [Deltaproteobacteria bacterium]|jgi:hypothetical protein|nr:hypothetical protein [Deltaproteobacteria bacterium]